MKKIAAFVALFTVIFINGALAVTLEDIKSAENGISGSAAENIERAYDGFSFYSAAKDISEGSYTADISGVIRKTLDMIFSEVTANMRVMGAVVLLGIMCTFIANLENGFGERGVTDAAFLTCFALLAGITAGGFSEASETARRAIEDMGLFTKSLVPVLTGMAVAEGKVISAPVMHTQILAGAAICSALSERVILPLVYSAFAISFINNITGALSLNKLSGLIDRLCKRLMAFMLLVFTAILALTNFAAGTAENMGMKTARFAVSTMVPVAGGALADTVTALTASAGMIKNSAGIAGITAIVLMSAYPVIKCAVMSFLYSLIGAVLEPICDKRLSSAVSAVGSCMNMLFALVAVSAALYIISASIMLSAVKL